MRWPTGKYNGCRIAGFSVSLRLNVFHWTWRPIVQWNHGNPYALWLCLRIGICPEYARGAPNDPRRS